MNAAPAGAAELPDPWTLRFTDKDPGRVGLREVLCAVGNGYVVSRAAAPEAVADGVHYPGTYLAGCYDTAVSRLDGWTVENADLVNCPNWLPLSFRAGDGPWFAGPLGEESWELDLRDGVLTRSGVADDGAGHRTRVIQRRIASQVRPHLLALETVLVPEDWSGRLQVRSGLDGDVRNRGVARYARLTDRHLAPAGSGVTEDGVSWLQTAALGSPLHLALAARTRLRAPDGAPPADRKDAIAPAVVSQIWSLDVERAVPVTVEKTVAVVTSRDAAVDDPLRSARRAAADAPDFEALVAEHRLRWRELWRRFGTEAGFADLGALHLDAFHLMQTCSEHSAEVDAGVPARGWHGEAYRGHVFWDELFVLQVLDLRFPEIAEAVLRYRHRRLPAARAAARALGRRGALFPWQSAADGTEATQPLHLNPLSGHWLPDHSRLQHHVGSAVAYAVWRHYQATGDAEFLADTGAELLLEVARFWADSACWDPARARWSIRGVLGPDEYHDAYPWVERPGLDDNTYTNVLASWVLARALDTLALLPARRRDELRERLALEVDEPQRWQEVGRRLHIPFHEGVLSQFEGYGQLQELDWEDYRRRYPDLRRLDRILEAEGDSVNRYKASKQADVLMLAYLFSPRELRDLLRRLGYPAGHDLLRRTIDYYLARTVHGSTLSAVVHAWVLTRADRRGSWRLFRDALTADLRDVQGGTTPEGVHLGAMAGSVDLLQRCYTGLELRDDSLWLDPRLPAPLRNVNLTLRYRGHWGLRITVERRTLTVSLPESPLPSVALRVRGRPVELRPGQTLTFVL